MCLAYLYTAPRCLGASEPMVKGKCIYVPKARTPGEETADAPDDGALF